MSILTQVGLILGYYASLVLFAALAAGLNLLCLAAAWYPSSERTERFFQRLTHRHFALFVRLVSAARIVPVRYAGDLGAAAAGGRVLVANHPGLMDVGWILARVPEALCICKPDIRRSPLFAATSRRAGYLANDRGHHLLRTAPAKIAQGNTLLVFPEGTRTTAGRLNPLKPGFVAIARLARAPIQLVHIHCDAPILTKARPWWLPPRLPAHVTVTTGPCLPPPGPDTTQALHHIEDWFRAMPANPTSVPAPLELAQVPVRT
jgi:1-acyl-sn-glycerol-3-phosphate acyltransferase